VPPASRTSLAEANAAFYAAFESLDLDRMDAVWDHGDTVYCVHPGGEVLRGWGPVRRSWAAIFAGTSYLQFIVTDVEARTAGSAGVVTCTENMLSGDGDGMVLGAAKAVATNLYVWDAGGAWRMVAHHASPVLHQP
jgi:ketosteroid isomerase-like protein